MARAAEHRIIVSLDRNMVSSLFWSSVVRLVQQKDVSGTAASMNCEIMVVVVIGTNTSPFGGFVNDVIAPSYLTVTFL